MSDVDPRLRERFAAYRNDVTTRVAGPGPDQARRTLRRRRRTVMVAAAAAAVVLVAAPVVANATLNGERPRPVPGQSIDPTAPPTSAPSPTPSATGSPSATATATAGPDAPDGRISRAQLLAARVDLPAWPSLVPNTCTTSDVRLGAARTPDAVPVLLDAELGHGDVDGDGATETVALVACRYAEASAKQVVAFDRDSDGRIVAVGRVVRTNDGFDDILGMRISSAGSVEVRVADIQPCCGTPTYLVREQTRTYRWNGERFTQTDGPTAWGKDPRLTDLKVAVKVTLGPARADTRRPLTMTFTVTNAGPRDADQVAFHNLEFDDHSGGDWSKCDTSDGAGRTIPSCRLPGPRADETRTYTFVSLVSDGTSGERPPPWTTEVEHWDAQDRWWPDLARQDNLVRMEIPYQ